MMASALHPRVAQAGEDTRAPGFTDAALHVGKLERIANLGHNGQRLARAHAAAGEQLSQVHPIHEFHQEEILDENWPAELRSVIKAFAYPSS